MLDPDVKRRLLDAAEAARQARESGMGAEPQDFAAEVRAILQPAIGQGQVSERYPDAVYAALLHFALGRDDDAVERVIADYAAYA